MCKQQALREAALRQTGKASFLGMNDPAQERAQLYDNAARFASAQNIPLGVKLSPEQIARLCEPILWYATQTVTGNDGQPYRVLVPQVYLPESAQMDRGNWANLAGGLIQGETVTLDMRARVHNTGYIAAETLSVDSAELINEKRSASWGRYTENVKGGYLAVWGDRVQPGGFISAATLSLNVERIESISGAFVENGQDATAALKAVFGERFSQRENEDHTFVDAHVKAGLGAAQVAIMVVAMIVAIYTAGAASGLIASAAESSALAAGMTAAQATAAGVAAASTTSSMMLAAGAMASSVTTQLLSTGKLNVGQMAKAGATGALTAGLLTLPVTGSGQSINQLAGIQDMAGIGQRLAQFDLNTLGSTLVGMAARGVVNAGVSTAAYGGSFGTAFKYSVVSDLAAVGANAVGQNELAGCKGRTACQLGVKGKWLGQSLKQDAAFGTGVGLGLAFEVKDVIASLPELPNAVSAIVDNPELLAQLPAGYAQQVKEAYQDYSTALEAAGMDGATAAGRYYVKLISLLTAPVAVVEGIVKLPSAVVTVVQKVGAIGTTAAKALMPEGKIAAAADGVAKGGAELSFGANARKLDFLFNRNIDQSKAYNAMRAEGNARRIGIADTPANRAEVTRLFNEAFNNPAAIVSPGKLPGSNVREFFLPGVTGTGSKIQFVEQNGKVITIMAK